MQKVSFFKFLIILLLLSIAGCGSGSDSKEKTPIEPPVLGTTPKNVQTLFGADPTKKDTDGDGLTDDFEIAELYPIALPHKLVLKLKNQSLG